MLRIGICDDECCARDTLRMAVEQILHNEEGKVIYEFSSGKSAANWVCNHMGEMDLLFLDIEMNGLSGMDAAKSIREQNNDILIVFVTGYVDYVFDGYSVQALGYLLKPVKTAKLQEVLNRGFKILNERESKTFTFQNSDGFYRIPLKNILYFYSDRRLVTLITINGNHSYYCKLDDIEENLDSDFIRIHQRYLVNRNAIERIEKI